MNRIQKFLIAGSVALLAVTGTYAQIYVEIRPSRPVFSRPAPPGPDYIWIEEDWAPGYGAYEWHGGYWARPRAGYYYSPGYWRHSSRGYIWVSGRWTPHRGGPARYSHPRHGYGHPHGHPRGHAHGHRGR